MNTKYIDLISQTFDFPQEEFEVDSNKNLHFHGIDTMKMVEEFGTPLKFTYLPKISENIQKAKAMFVKAMHNHKYKAKYHYCYCTK
ncbi:MAG: arginine decarboxylase, partial [Bacteroidetes bacterium HGW-Bacteroidetes-3]